MVSPLHRTLSHRWRKYRRAELTIPEILAPVSASWVGWWTTYDPTLPENPGLALTGTVGVDAVVDSWTNQRSGGVGVLSATGSNRPSYAADGAHFSGRPVVQCFKATSQILQGTFTSLVPVGSRPMLVVVARPREVDASQNTIFVCTRSGTSLTQKLQVNGSTLATTHNQHPNTDTNAAASFVDTDAHIWAGWVTAGEGSRIARDGVVLATDADDTAVTVRTVAGMTIGAAQNGLVPCNVSIAEIYLFTAYIGDSIFEQLCAAALAP